MLFQIKAGAAERDRYRLALRVLWRSLGTLAVFPRTCMFHLKNLFTRAPCKPAERSVYFHEDDYCQIELLPAAARQHCVSQMGIIDDFAARHDDGGMGFTSIYVRPDAPHTFAELRIATTAFSNAITQHLPAYDSVFTGYSTHRELCQSTLAWGDDSFTFFADQKADVIQHVWLSLGTFSSAEAERLTHALRALPSSGNILLADWSWSLVAMLSDPASLHEYLQQRTANP